MTLARTLSLMSRARRVLGWGERALDVRPLYFGEFPLPQFAEAISGYEVVDSADARYIDWFGGSCNLLGHREPRVQSAIRTQLEAGPLFPLLNPLEVEVAELLVEMVPCAEMVAFGKNGSDGLSAAVRLARMVTGREVILHYGYHGFHDWFAAASDASEGVPAVLRELIRDFPYDSLTDLELLFDSYAGRVAAVVMEPVREALPRRGYLQKVRELTRKAGALLIFDEVITALRLAPGGAQEYFGVVPDLACLGKSMGNGMPLSAVVGPRELMQHYPRTGVGMTFQGETLSLAAARTVLKIVRDEPVSERISTTGARIRDAFNERATALGLDASMTGHPARPQITFGGSDEHPAEYLRGVFLTDCLRRGVMTGPMLLPSAAHDERAIEKTTAAFSDALAVVARLTSERFAGWTLPGEPAVLGYVDDVTLTEKGRTVSGWIVVNGKSADSLRVTDGDGTSCGDLATVARWDVEAIHPGSNDPRGCGFLVKLPLPPPPFITIEAERNGVVARCTVDLARVDPPVALQHGRLVP